MLFEYLNDIRLLAGESLLGTYEALLEHKPKGTEPDCPYSAEGDCQLADNKYHRENGKYSCQCPSENTLYSTDALRVHERMIPDSANGEMFGEIMQVFERLVVIHILRGFKQQNVLHLLKNTAIVIDGSTRCFWISSLVAFCDP